MELFKKIFSLFVDFYNNPVYLQQFIDNRFFLILLVVVLIRLKYATYKSMWLAALINIPGTFLHELMHFIFGLFLNAHPTNLSILPRKSSSGNGYIMGEVIFSNLRFYNAFPTAIAPIFLLIIGFLLNRYFLPVIHPSYINYIGYVLLQTVIIENAIPSSVDIRQAFRYPLGTLFYLSLFAVCVYLV